MELLGHTVNLAGIAIGAGWLVTLLLPHLKIISQPGPVEYNEPAIWNATYLLDHGRNPYTMKELPGAAYCFGPLYNYVVIAFKPLFGTDYPAHRMVNLLFLAGSLFLLVRLMCRLGTGLGIALLSAALYYWMCLGNIMITARPDLMGLFLFLLGVFVPWERNYARWPSIFGLACSVAAFQCKFYFAVGGCATLLGVFLVRSKREGYWLALAYFIALGASFLGFWLAFPFYYIETVVAQHNTAALTFSDSVSAMHTRMFLGRSWPFLLLMAGGFAAWLWRWEKTGERVQTKAAGPAPDWTVGTREEALSLSFLALLALVYFYMGRSAGAYFTYHLHLLFPPMFVLAALVLRRPWVRIGFGVLLSVFVFSWARIPSVPDASGPYRRLEQLIFNTHGEVLGLPCVTDIFERQSRRVLHDGNTMFLGSALADNRATWDPLAAIIDRQFHETEAEVRSNVAARAYEVVLTEADRPMFCDEKLLRQNYDEIEQVDYYTYFGHSPVRIWKPKSRQG